MSEPAQSEGASTQVIVGGVDLADMQRAYSQHPVLDRWHKTTVRLIPDLYEMLEQATARVEALTARNKELVEQLKELQGEPDEENVPAPEEEPGEEG